MREKIKSMEGNTQSTPYMLPPYFKEYMDGKFSDIDKQLGGINNRLDSALQTQDNVIQDLRDDVKWLNQKVWMALGALAIISLVGGIFAFYFKELNKAQIYSALQSTLSDYDIKVEYPKD